MDELTAVEAIQQTITEFSDGGEDDGLVNTFTALSKSVRRASCNSAIKEKMVKLEQEVENLEKEIEERKRRVNSQQDTLSSMEDKFHTGKTQTLNDVQKETESLQKKIQTMQRITHLHVHNYTCYTIKSEKTTEQRVYAVQGTLRDIDFKVEFGIKEDMEMETTCVEQLSISVPDDVYKELKHPLTTISEEKSLQGFFTLLQSYSKWSQFRKETFKHFVSKYTDYVTKEAEDDATNIIIHSPSLQKGPRLKICWTMSVGPTYNAKPSVLLEVQQPDGLDDHDKVQVLREAPEQFQQMMEEYGIERSIDMLVTLMMQL